MKSLISLIGDVDVSMAYPITTVSYNKGGPAKAWFGSRGRKYYQHLITKPPYKQEV